MTLRLLFRLCLVVLITFGLLEAGARWILGFRPISIAPTVWEDHPLRGWSHRPGASEIFVRLGFEQPIQINSRGLREREIPYERTPGVQRILVIGDSGLVGFEVPADSVFTRVAERELRAQGVRVEIINGGCRGYGSDQSYLFLESEGTRYGPDVVLYFWADNDPDDNVTVHRAFRRFGKSYFDLAPDGALVLRGTPVPRFEYASALRVDERGETFEPGVDFGTRAHVWLRDNGAGQSAFAAGTLQALTVAPQLATRFKEMGSTADAVERLSVDRMSRTFRLTTTIIEEMRRITEEMGARFEMIGPELRWPRAIRDELELPELGLWRRFKERVPDDATIHAPFDSHWNELGHEIYGEALAEVLIENDLVSR